jgi:hypothetical protein
MASLYQFKAPRSLRVVQLSIRRIRQERERHRVIQHACQAHDPIWQRHLFDIRQVQASFTERQLALGDTRCPNIDSNEAKRSEQ